MTKDMTTLPGRSITSLVGAKTITAVSTYRHGVVTVLEFKFSDASTNFVKFLSNNGLEIGGTSEVGTGTKVTF